MYTIELTEDDMKAIRFIGYRYEWSNWCRNNLEVGINDLREHMAWEFVDAVNADDCLYPMLDTNSRLFDKLNTLYNEVV